MLPSPSLGPPLLSASWSPPLPCGMGLAVWAGAVTDGAAGADGGAVTVAGADGDWWRFVGAVGCVVAECAGAVGLAAGECAAAAVPQPAASTASRANPAADRTRVNDMTCPFRSAMTCDQQAEMGGALVVGPPAHRFIDDRQGVREGLCGICEGKLGSGRAAGWCPAGISCVQGQRGVRSSTRHRR